MIIDDHDRCQWVNFSSGTGSTGCPGQNPESRKTVCVCVCVRACACVHACVHACVRVSLKSVLGFRSHGKGGGLKIGLLHYFGYWLLQKP